MRYGALLLDNSSIVLNPAKKKRAVKDSAYSSE